MPAAGQSLGDREPTYVIEKDAALPTASQNLADRGPLAGGCAGLAEPPSDNGVRSAGRARCCSVVAVRVGIE